MVVDEQGIIEERRDAWRRPCLMDGSEHVQVHVDVERWPFVSS